MAFKLMPIPAIAFVLAALSAPVLAAGLEERIDGGIRYMSGGVGQTEAEAMRQAAPGYSLNLLFATEQGRFMSGVQVTLKKSDGTPVLSTLSEGPMLLVDLPPGRYTMDVFAEGRRFTRKVKLAPGQRRQVVVRWPTGLDGGR